MLADEGEDEDSDGSYSRTMKKLSDASEANLEGNVLDTYGNTFARHMGRLVVRNGCPPSTESSPTEVLRSISSTTQNLESVSPPLAEIVDYVAGESLPIANNAILRHSFSTDDRERSINNDAIRSFRDPGKLKSQRQLSDSRTYRTRTKYETPRSTDECTDSTTGATTKFNNSAVATTSYNTAPIPQSNDSGSQAPVADIPTRYRHRKSRKIATGDAARQGSGSSVTLPYFASQPSLSDGIAERSSFLGRVLRLAKEQELEKPWDLGKQSSRQRENNPRPEKEDRILLERERTRQLLEGIGGQQPSDAQSRGSKKIDYRIVTLRAGLTARNRRKQ